jgi:rod shape determining protein RodA
MMRIGAIGARLQRISWIMVLTIAALMVIGIMFVYSAEYVSSGEWESSVPKYQRQIMWALAGIVCYFCVAAMDYHRLGKLSGWIYLIGILLLIVVLVPGVGVKKYGAQRWIRLPFFTMQPSELVKLAVLLALAQYMSRPDIDLRNMRTVLVVLALIGLPFVLIARQPDLGTAMVLVPFAFVMMLIAGVQVRVLVTIVVIGLMLVPVAWFNMDDYQQDRIRVFLGIDQDPLGTGWTKIQSKLAVGSGALVGKGFLRGTQNILGFLPRSVAPTDFIYSVIAEERGFIGSASVLILFAILIVCGMRTALLTRDKFGRLLAVGVVTILFAHTFVNIAMTIGLMPITGLPLPLLSYGGTFTISTMAGLGLLQSVYIRRPRNA